MAASTGRRPRFVPDLRLVIGLVLVAGSVAGVVGIVRVADERTTVYAASDELSPGDHIDAGDLVTRSVALDGADRMYLTAGDIPADGLIVTQTVRSGELLPQSAVGSTAGLDSTAIVLALSSPVSSAVVAGSAVDVWAAPTGNASATSAEDGFGPPVVLVPGATVVRVIEDSSFGTGSADVSIEVLVPRDRIARLLESVADEDALAAVPAGLPWEG